MHDNKVRLSQDVLEKAEQIASEWGVEECSGGCGSSISQILR